MSTTAATEYGKLLSETKPEVVVGEKQNQAYVERLEKLTGKKRVSRADEKLIGLLTVLVEDYKSKNHPVPEVGPIDIVRHLMDEHNLRQKDLVDVFGTESIVSDVLNGKRELAEDHIRRLSGRFHVSTSVFSRPGRLIPVRRLKNPFSALLLFKHPALPYNCTNQQSGRVLAS